MRRGEMLAADRQQRLTVGWRDPGYAAKADPLIGQISRFFIGSLAIDAVRIDLTVVNTAGFFRKAIADVIAVGLDAAAHLDQRCAKLSGRNRRRGFPRAAETRSHYRLFDRSIAAIGAGNLAGLLLCFEPVAVTKPPLELMAVSTTQREQDHRHHL